MQRVAGFLAPAMRLPVSGVAYGVGGNLYVWQRVVNVLFRVNGGLVRVCTVLRWPIAIAAVGVLVWRGMSVSSIPVPYENLSEFGFRFGLQSPIVAGLFGACLVALVATVVFIALVGLPLWRKRSPVPPRERERFVPRRASLIDMVIDLNRRQVDWTMRHRFAAFWIAALAFASVAVPLLSMEVTPFGQDSHEDSVEFRVDFNDDFTLEEAANEVAVYEEFLDSKKEAYGFDHWNNRFDETDANLTMFWERLPGETEIKRVEKALREDLPRIPGHTLRFYDREQTSQRSTKIAVFTLHGPDAAELENLGRTALGILEEVPGLSQVSSELEYAPEQIRVEVDRERASGLAVSTQTIQQTISYILAGYPLPRYQEGGRDVPLLIEYDEEEVAGLPTLRDMNVFSESGMIPLSSVADLSFAKGSHYIRRKNGKTTFTMWAEVDDPLKIIPITQAGYAALSQMDMPRGYSVGTEDSALARQQEEFAELKRAFSLSIVLVFLLMGILFESVMLPFSVLFTIPFAVVGAMWTLFLTGTPMDSMGWIGMIILAGVVVNNGIVLIDRIHGLRGKGLARAEAVIMGCGQRVRPVLMTALTTVCGLAPMIVTPPPPNGFDYRTLATIVAGGLVASTFFTLWVVPLAYTILDDLATVIRARVGWWLRKPKVRVKVADPDPLASIEVEPVDLPR